MISYHYDVCILGDSVSNLLTSVFLAKKGFRILLLVNDPDSSSFPAYYPFYFSSKGPFMETIRMLGLEKSISKKIDNISLQFILPHGRGEIYKHTDKRNEELRWLFGKDFESAKEISVKLNSISDKVKRSLSDFFSTEKKLRDRILQWVLKKRLTGEIYSAVNKGCFHYLHKILMHYIAFPILDGISKPVSPFFHSLLDGSAFFVENYPHLLTDPVCERFPENIIRMRLSEIEVEKDLKRVRRNREAFTYKFLIIDTTIAKRKFPELLGKKFGKFFPCFFWYPLQLEVRREGFPVGMGKHVFLVDPDRPPEEGNFVYIQTSSLKDTVLLTAFTFWKMDDLKNEKWVEVIVGTVMDRLMEFMPFLNNHLLHLIYPERIEEIPDGFFNYIYRFKKIKGLFYPVVKCRIKKDIFLNGPEMFPQWGSDAETISALYVTHEIDKLIRQVPFT